MSKIYSLLFKKENGATVTVAQMILFAAMIFIGYYLTKK